MGGRSGGGLRRRGRCSFFIFLSSSSLEDAATDVHLRIVVVPSFLFVVATTSMAVGGRGERGGGMDVVHVDVVELCELMVAAIFGHNQQSN